MKRFLLGWSVALLAVASAQAQTGIFKAGARQLYIHCEGARHGAAVLLEAGGWRDSTDWIKVQPEVAHFTQVCSYDREGLGKSTVDGVRNPDTAESIDEEADDLRRLLQAARVPPPYILVGQSAGGVKVRRFTRDYPSEVTGMVLVDSAHEEQIWRFLAIDPSSVQGPPAIPENARRGGMLGTPGERLVWHDDIPLIVLEHGLPFAFEGSMAQHAAEFEAAMHAMQVDLASRSSKGQLRTATKSGHDIMFDQPELVVQAIHDVWSSTH
jgi:pimeloyl-ACP methyl ester carboxylesterase